MPVVGRSYSALNNRVYNLPSLPTDIVRGSISIEASFEQHPTGSIVIEAIPESEINTYRAAYNVVGKPIQIYDYWFRIANYSETRENMEGPGLPAPIIVFNIAVNLEGYNASAVTEPIYVRRQSPDNVNRVSAASTISLVNLAAKGNIEYEGYNQDITIPRSEGVNYSINFDSQLAEKLRVKNKYVDYSSRAVRVRDLDKGASYTFTSNEILDSIETSRQKPVQYNLTLINGKDGILAESEAAVRRIKIRNFFGDDPLVKRPPLERTIREGDLNPTIIPADLNIITSLDLNFDSSGPRKTFRESKYLNNKLVQETYRAYGLAYLAEDIKNPMAENPNAPEDTPALLEKSPQNWWTQIEERITQYKYEQLNATSRLTAVDSLTNKRYQVLYRDEEGKSVSTSFRNKYLVEVYTFGWRLGRYRQEQLGEDSDSDSRIIREELDSGNLTGVDITYFNRLWDAIQFRRIPLKEIRDYFIVDPQDYYDKLEDIPFETQKVEADQIGLPSSLGEVIIATPSRDYIYPMIVLSESFQSHAFSAMDHPENVLIRDERNVVRNDGSLTEQQKEEELRLLKLLPDLVTGEDTFQVTRREIQPSKNTRRKVDKNRRAEEDIYIEYNYSASSQDDDFRNSLQNIAFTEVVGRPGQPEVLQDIWVRRSELNSRRICFGSNCDNRRKTLFYISNVDQIDFAENVQSISVNTSLLSEAKVEARAQLALQNFLNTSQESLTLAWFYPNLKPGDFIRSVDTFSKKQKRIKSVSFQLDYQGFVDGQKVVTCNGTSLVLGLWRTYTDNDFRTTKAYEKEGELEITANTRVAQREIGEQVLFTTLRTRRNKPDPETVDP